MWLEILMSEKRKWKLDVLGFFLRKLSQEELVDCLKTTIQAVCGDDEEALENITHTIVTYVHAKEVMKGESKLEDYRESHRAEIKKMIESLSVK